VAAAAALPISGKKAGHVVGLALGAGEGNLQAVVEEGVGGVVGFVGKGAGEVYGEGDARW
jgi:hypothetical protein